MYQIVIDTNILVAALRSQRGASYHLLMLLEKGKFESNISVPLMLEYEDVAKRLIGEIALTEAEIEDILDYVCSASHRQKIFYLWRPYLKDPKDDMVLELAVAANCEFIVTYNIKDFQGAEHFGVTAVTPKKFLEIIGELP
jgi:putative PIN family toxin of toxin-antitoxin system